MASLARRWAKKLADPWLDRIAARVAHRLRQDVPVTPPPVASAGPVIVERVEPDAGTATAIAWGLKLYGSQLARELYQTRLQPLINQAETGAYVVPLTSKLCEESDIESAWFLHWCRQLRMAPIYHRKVWEECFALQAMWEAGMLRDGKFGLCFGAGAEPLPSYLASRGVRVLATDVAADSAAAAAWIETGQHATLARLHRPELVDHATFERLVSFRNVDMNEIPTDLDEKFDFCWSLCALEHVGSTELAVRFIERAMDCLKPGGLAFHTTEFNLTSTTETVTQGWCVLFTRPQIEALSAKLRARGHEVLPVSFDPGSQPLDQYIDLPPWRSPNALSLPSTPHLRLALLGYAATSIALIIRKGSSVSQNRAEMATDPY